MSVQGTKRKPRTDWKRVDAMKDEDIDTSDIPELGEAFFKNAVFWPGVKNQITLRLDPDVLSFFRKHGRGYQTVINGVPRKYMEAQTASSKRPTKRRDLNLPAQRGRGH